MAPSHAVVFGPQGEISSFKPLAPEGLACPSSQSQNEHSRPPSFPQNTRFHNLSSSNTSLQPHRNLSKMARKRNKGAQVQTADPCSALQTQKPQPAQSRAQKQPNPRPKPELKQKPEKKPAVVITSTNKTEQPYRKKPKASGNSSSKQPGPAPKTAFKIVKVSLEPLQTKTGQKMARNRNNKSAPAQKAPAAKLDLPEGYTAPKTKNHGPRKRPKKEDKVCLRHHRPPHASVS